ncbi:thiol peroxidase, atypical 2-Cys peroxiredoxin [Abditibacterium utsteinense]|uniref:Thiol peroxidase, atypical 2-Cys peroxiredoxin n=1 Tax=Abditibacterium utsteinense TaxID=1960156 RepID=A0A2S8SXD8_9BACT|nr:thiol peroxidase [Abditibacterium utsteinense]PQV65465.1 thiol peroxidase, atypical 2-Cys peroxiredoxin [Abditibacterium utsteinense]
MASTVTLHGKPVELSGTPPQIGDTAPAFELTGGDMSPVKLSDSAGKIRIISIVPSIDTAVCDLQTKRFNQEIDKLPDSVIGYTISVDTPFAQNRWCAAEGVEKMHLLSDYKGQTFGHDYGLYINDMGTLARSVIIVDQNDKVAYLQLVPEIGQEPNYEEVLQKARELS